MLRSSRKEVLWSRRSTGDPLHAGQATCLKCKALESLPRIHPFFYRRGPVVNVLPKIRSAALRSPFEHLLKHPESHRNLETLRRCTIEVGDAGAIWSSEALRINALSML